MKIINTLYENILQPLIVEALKRSATEIYLKIKRGHRKLGIASASIPPYGWEELRRIPYEAVIWIVQRDARGPYAKHIFPRKDPRPSEIRVAIPPRCPTCETELEELRRFFSGYTWSCVGCGFSKHSKTNFYQTADRVERLARRQQEKESGFSCGG